MYLVFCINGNTALMLNILVIEVNIFFLSTYCYFVVNNKYFWCIFAILGILLILVLYTCYDNTLLQQFMDLQTCL